MGGRFGCSRQLAEAHLCGCAYDCCIVRFSIALVGLNAYLREALTINGSIGKSHYELMQTSRG